MKKRHIFSILTLLSLVFVQAIPSEANQEKVNTPFQITMSSDTDIEQMSLIEKIEVMKDLTKRAENRTYSIMTKGIGAFSVPPQCFSYGACYACCQEIGADSWHCWIVTCWE